MRIFRWSSNFHLDVESLIAPVWISPPNLYFFLFDKQCLLSIGRLISRPLTLDTATIDLFRPSVERICVEVDLLKKLPRRNWHEYGDSIPGFWQGIKYEKIPNYCKHCRRLGHEISTCKQANPHLTKALAKKDKNFASYPSDKHKEAALATQEKASPSQTESPTEPRNLGSDPIATGSKECIQGKTTSPQAQELDQEVQMQKESPDAQIPRHKTEQLQR